MTAAVSLGRRVLLVAPDDVRRGDDAALLEAEGWSVDCAADPVSAAEAWARQPADAIIERDLAGALCTRSAPGGAETSRAVPGAWTDERALLRLSAHRGLAASRHASGLRSRVDAVALTQEAIAAATDDLWERREELEQRAGRTRKLAQLVAHDLKNHLSVVKTNVEYVLSEVGEGSPCCGQLDEASMVVEDAFQLVAAFVAAAGRAA